MSKKVILLIVLGLTLLYPIISLIGITNAFDALVLESVRVKILNFQLSIWISWIIFASVAVFYKWTRQKNVFFWITYIFLVIGFGIFGIYYQKMVNIFNVPTLFIDTYTLGLIVILQNIITALVLTVFLHACVWWFTRRWHRR